MSVNLQSYPKPKPVVELNGRESSQYSITRAILSAVEKQNCFEREVSTEIERIMRSEGITGHGGMYIPTFTVRAGLDGKTTTKGKELVFTEAGPYLEALRANSVVLKLGATVLPGLRNNLDLPGLVQGAAAQWMDENPAAPITEVAVSTGKAPLKLRTLTSLVSYSRQLLAQSTPQIDELLITDIGRANAAALDKAALHGDGVLQPAGISTLAPAGQIVDFAGPVVFAKVCAMEKLVGNANAETEAGAFVTTPTIRSDAQQTAKAATLNEPIWSELNTVCGKPAAATTNALKGAAQTIIYGSWDQVVFGEWGALEIVYDVFSNKKQGMVELETFYYCDLTFRHLESFAISANLTALP
jgi:HK97 family phage major capsid protein